MISKAFAEEHERSTNIYRDENAPADTPFLRVERGEA
jgi:hypothetical protein